MERYELRGYQKEAVEAALSYFKNIKDCEGEDLNPLIVVPTGGGKSILIADVARRFILANRRVLIVQHRKELIEQNAEKIRSLLDPKYQIGVYSAGLNQKNIGHHVTVAGVQSIYKKAEKLGPIDLCIIDECHLISPEGEGMYRTLIKRLKEMNPKCRFLGFTATPFRMSTGPLTSDGGLFDEVAYNVPIQRLVDEGYLSRIISKSSLLAPDTSSIKKRGDFLMSEAEKVFSADPVIAGAVREILQFAHDRKSILVFCTGVKHAAIVSQALQNAGVNNEVVTGETMLREDILARFRSGKLRCIVNVDVLTTGFDAPNIDCIAILRPTQSAGLFAQMVGRGLRISPGKKDCLLLDFGENLLRHGPIDKIEMKPMYNEKRGIVMDQVVTMPQKLCGGCGDLVAIQSQKCKLCGFEFPVEIKHDSKSSELPVLSQDIDPIIYHVDRIVYSRHRKEGKPDSLKINYFSGFQPLVSEFLCFEHGGYAAKKAQISWARFCDERADTVEQALFFAHIGVVKTPCKIRCDRDPKSGYLRVTGWKFAEGIKVEVLGFEDFAGVKAANEKEEEIDFASFQ